MQIANKKIAVPDSIYCLFQEMANSHEVIRLWKRDDQEQDKDQSQDGNSRIKRIELRMNVLSINLSSNIIILKVSDLYDYKGNLGSDFKTNDHIYGLSLSRKFIFKAKIDDLNCGLNEIVMTIPNEIIDIDINGNKKIVNYSNKNQSHLRLVKLKEIYVDDEVDSNNTKKDFISSIHDNLREYVRKSCRNIVKLWIAPMDDSAEVNIKECLRGDLSDLSPQGASFIVSSLPSFLKKDFFIVMGGIGQDLKIRAKIRHISQLEIDSNGEQKYRIGIKFYSMTRGPLAGTLS